MNVLFLSWLYAYYCFDYKWALEGIRLPNRLHFFECNWAYFAGAQSTAGWQLSLVRGPLHVADWCNMLHVLAPCIVCVYSTCCSVASMQTLCVPCMVCCWFVAAPQRRRSAQHFIAAAAPGFGTAAGFGFPCVIATIFWPFHVGAALANLLFPVFIMVACGAKPVEAKSECLSQFLLVYWMFAWPSQFKVWPVSCSWLALST